MNSKLTNHDRLAKVIEDAVVQGSGYAAARAASTIDEEFILIKKSDLPPVLPKKLPWNDVETLKARTAGYHGRTPETYWDRALDFISIAIYAEGQKEEQAKRELEGMRNDAYNMLHPKAAPMWSYEDLNSETQKQVDVVVNLMRQVDELKVTK